MKALVIGGGIGGFSAALACTDKGIEVEVFEQADGFSANSAWASTCCLMPSKSSSELGLLDRLDATASSRTCCRTLRTGASTGSTCRR